MRCIIIDFSKAFDTVNHEILLSKLQKFPIPANILKWIISFLTDRPQSTKVNSVCSSVTAITRRIIQGSVVGPYGFIIYAHDFKVVGLLNSAQVYWRLYAENTDVSAEDEMRNVLLWSDDNKLSVNLSKWKEIVFRRPSVKLDILPDPLADVERVSCAKLLGVFIDYRLKFTEHVDYVIKISNQRLYLLQQLRKQGLCDKCLDVVFCAIILSIITLCTISLGWICDKRWY